MQEYYPATISLFRRRSQSCVTQETALLGKELDVMIPRYKEQNIWVALPLYYCCVLPVKIDTLCETRFVDILCSNICEQLSMSITALHSSAKPVFLSARADDGLHIRLPGFKMATNIYPAMKILLAENMSKRVALIQDVFLYGAIIPWPEVFNVFGSTLEPRWPR